MNKTTVRFATVGTVLLLGALVIALAHHDARQQPSRLSFASPSVETLKPIEVENIAPLRIRANDDLLQPQETINPLRSGPPPLSPVVESPTGKSLVKDSIATTMTAVSGLQEEISAQPDVVTASGEGELRLPPSTTGISTPPPSLGFSPPSPLGSTPSLSSETNPQIGLPTAPPSLGQNISDLPDPQRPSTAVPISPPPRAQEKPWLQAAPLPQSGPKNLVPAQPIPTQSSTAPYQPNNLPPATSPLTNYQAAPHQSAANQSAANQSAATPQANLPPRGHMVANGSRSALAGTAFGSLVSNQPGNRHLDGSQNPIMLIQMRTAGEIQVGKKATTIITVRNAGNSTAHDVEVVDSVPNGASFAESMPATTPTPEGILRWQLGEMGPGEERTISVQIVPERQGEIGSTAVVRFAAQASVRTIATQPKVEISYTATPETLIGSPYSVDIVLKNSGTGVARGVKLEADLPANIRHKDGEASLEASFGDIAPGESKHIRLDTIATEPGQGACDIRAVTEDGVQHEQRIEVRVLAPALQASITGPNKRFLDRQATFAITIKNAGSAAATNCEFVMRLPSGLNFNSANKNGTYDRNSNSVYWTVTEFPAGHAEPVELTVLPVESGTLPLLFQGTADLGIKVEARGSLNVEEHGELAFSIDQDADPIEVSSTTTYTVEVRNVGRVDRNVQLVVQLPPGSKVHKVDAPVRSSVNGDQLVFESIPQMDGRSSVKYRVTVQHTNVGTQVVRAQLTSQNRPTPVIKEEDTVVYNDRD